MKVTIQLASLILAVKQSFLLDKQQTSYNIDFFQPTYNRLQNLPIIKESQIQKSVIFDAQREASNGRN
jgi:hypothetical protein